MTYKNTNSEDPNTSQTPMGNTSPQSKKSIAQKLQDLKIATKIIILIPLAVLIFIASYTMGQLAKNSTEPKQEVAGNQITCPDGSKSPTTQGCYERCPPDWAGTETPTHCVPIKISSPAGMNSSNVKPKACSNGKILYEGLCYNVPTGWEITTPGFIGKICPSGWSNDGENCSRQGDTYGRGAGYPIWDEDKCRRKKNGRCEKSGALWYPSCKPEYVAFGCCLCKRSTKTKSRNVTAETGTALDLCADGLKLVGRLCYPVCPAGFERNDDNVGYCSTACPDRFSNRGTDGCEKPRTKIVSTD